MRYFCFICCLCLSFTTLTAQTQLAKHTPTSVEYPIIKLKNILLKNLLADQQIASTGERVELEFRHDKILINQKAMRYDLYEKYTYLLKGLGFTLADYYVIILKRDYISMKAYQENSTTQSLIVDAEQVIVQL